MTTAPNPTAQIWTLIAHMVTVVTSVAAVTVLAAAGKVPGSSALVVIIGVAGITGPSLGRPNLPNTRSTHVDG